jgi:hypothetical protein
MSDPRIQELEVEGWKVVRQRTYENLRREFGIAQRMLAAEVEHNESTRQWGVRAHDEQRRLSDRLTRVIAVAVEMGVDTHALFTRLGENDEH